MSKLGGAPFQHLVGKGKRGGSDSVGWRIVHNKIHGYVSAGMKANVEILLQAWKHGGNNFNRFGNNSTTSNNNNNDNDAVGIPSCST